MKELNELEQSHVQSSKAYITIAIRLRYDYDEKLTC